MAMEEFVSQQLADQIKHPPKLCVLRIGDMEIPGLQVEFDMNRGCGALWVDGVRHDEYEVQISLKNDHMPLARVYNEDPERLIQAGRPTKALSKNPSTAEIVASLQG